MLSQIDLKSYDKIYYLLIINNLLLQINISSLLHQQQLMKQLINLCDKMSYIATNDHLNEMLHNIYVFKQRLWQMKFHLHLDQGLIIPKNTIVDETNTPR